MACLRCSGNVNPKFRIDRNNIKVNPGVKPGDTFTIEIEVKNDEWLLSLYGRICTHEGDNLVSQSGSFKVSPRGIHHIKLTGIMPDNSLNFRLSLIKESYGFVEKCADSVDITVNVGDETEEAEKVKVYGTQDTLNEIMEWIEENTIIVIGFIVLIAIALMMRRK